MVHYSNVSGFIMSGSDKGDTHILSVIVHGKVSTHKCIDSKTAEAMAEAFTKATAIMSEALDKAKGTPNADCEVQ